LILVEDRLLRERCLGRKKVGVFQLQQQEHTEVKPEKIFPRQKGESNLPRRRTTYKFLRSHVIEQKYLPRNRNFGKCPRKR
jgi:hypothetical protein